jgi:cyclic beta-1,2-glucan synthetase
LLNPINHASTRADVHRYKTEPYAITADIYARDPHMGRGGWSWYTGSAGWMQRAGIESILGVRIEGAQLFLDPCIPKSWPGFEIKLRYRTAWYEITVENASGVNRGVASLALDGTIYSQRPARLTLHDDSLTHQIQVMLGNLDSFVGIRDEAFL